MRYQFTKNVMADGRTFKAGDEIDAGELQAGTIASLQYVGHVVEVPEPKLAPPKFETKPVPPAPLAPAPIAATSMPAFVSPAKAAAKK